MKADDFNYKEYQEIFRALRETSSTKSLSEEVRESIMNFFDENKEVDYNTFLILYNDKYGDIIKNYREYLKLKTLNIIKIAAILYIITFVLGVISLVAYFAGWSIPEFNLTVPHNFEPIFFIWKS